MSKLQMMREISRMAGEQEDGVHLQNIFWINEMSIEKIRGHYKRLKANEELPKSEWIQDVA